ncbi:MAG: HAD family hydrolase [Bacteroidota bacterium]|nr:HAD family hydrolase [Bacteroidota bacterium]
MLTTFSEIDLNGIKGVLLDLDDTLYPYDICHNFAYEKCKVFAGANYAISEVDFDLTWKAARSKVHNDLHGQGASHSRLLYFQKQYEQVFGHTDAAYVLKMEDLYWTEFISVMKIDSDAKDFLKLLKSKRIPSCIVTDLTTQIQLKKWLHLGLENYIDFIVTSEEAGVEKPASYIFNMGLEKLKLNPSDVIMIGDSEKKDIEGAKLLGIKTYHIKANSTFYKTQQ